MTAIIKNKFRLQNARDFLQNFDDAEHTTPRNHYLFIGKPTTWGAGTQSEELSPPAPADTYEEEHRIWDEMMGLKKIDASSVSLVIPRSDWDTTGQTVYAVYDDKDSDLYNQPTPERAGELSPNVAGNFYVLTEEFDLFICLENGVNSVSTVKPVRQTPATNLVDYSAQDGYVWKFVGSVKPADVTKFSTDSWTPIETLTADDGSFQWDVQQAAVAGEVVTVIIDNKGSGYTNTYSGGFVGGFSNASGVGVAELSAPRSAVNDAYINGQIHIISGPDAGSIYTIAGYNGTTGVITLTTPWAENNGTIIADATSTCEILPKLTITTNGTAVNFRPVVDGSDQISRIRVITAGSGSTYINVTVDDSLGGTGAVARAVLSDGDGLGADIEKDLGATYLMLNTRLEYAEGLGDFPTNNDYRQLGIIRDVKDFGGATLATSATLIATKKLNLENVSGTALTYDEVFQISSDIQAIALEFTASQTTPGEGTLTYIQNPTTGYGTFTAGSTIQGTESVTPFTADIKATNGVEDEELAKGIGQIIYLENRRAILRSQDQIEDIKAIIEF